MKTIFFANIRANPYQLSEEIYILGFELHIFIALYVFLLFFFSFIYSQIEIVRLHINEAEVKQNRKKKTQTKWEKNQKTFFKLLFLTKFIIFMSGKDNLLYNRYTFEMRTLH